AGRQQHGPHGGGDAHGDRAHIRADEVHGVVNRQSRVDHSAGRVHVQRDVAVRVLAVEQEQLRVYRVYHLLIDRGAQEDDALLEQQRVDVVRTLASGRRLDDHRHNVLRLQEAGGEVFGAWGAIAHAVPAVLVATPAGSPVGGIRSPPVWSLALCT